jgi:hypothetical protein
LKLIELQVAIPRTVDAGKSAIDLSQKGLIQQSHISESNRKNERTDSKKVTHKEKTGQSNLHKNNHTPKNTDDSKHPFKGLKIDYSG